ncbi:hypothetical protein FRACYDRAFT_237434 [Fragilariopsis cylindrus CCMP1102]|uniref:Ankyrin n=1 Tax=Fragilariopsis cylindrus CCMP1102 TaxID=635003 RepID=A0A1E7FLZ1_9STRA|nr:hypothetical protein FRACYDRAFT_237434 [Fragilariopsis cylindrus CCMP1102]|eukprot:OEU19144.1 hypothetical protein FRACYDRAFT_237434 [Fragilariopsis cylindrus CCMP1102]
MMEANIENNELDQHEVTAQQIIDAATKRLLAFDFASSDEQQQQAIFFLKKMILVLEQKETFPLRTRNKTDELVETFLIEAAQDEQQQAQQAVVLLKKLILVLQYRETFPLRTRNQTDELVEKFLAELEDDVHNMLCADLTDPNSDNYRGLDSERDTEAEVEAIVRIFPEVLTRIRIENEDDEHVSLHYPIQLLAFAHNEDEDGSYGCNVKAVSFIPVVARLAIEFGCFEEEERGGLLCEDRYGENVLHCLTLSCGGQTYNQDEQCKAADDKYLQVLIQLRKLGLLKKEDIKRYSLLHKLCREKENDYFAEKRFRFLVEWDPTALLHAITYGWLPIHCAAFLSSPRGFELVFEYGIRYFPKKKGISLLFKKTNHDDSTPFQYACEIFGHEKVMEVVEDTLAHCYASSDDTPPLHVVNALMTAAIDKNIHLDCVYFLMRRKPDILMEVLSPLPYISKLRKRKRNDHH